MRVHKPTSVIRMTKAPPGPCIFTCPRGEHPFYSVGDLRHIDLIEAVDLVEVGNSLCQAGHVRNHGPSFVLGSSYADAFIDFGALYQLDHRNEPYPDYSWLCNYQFWDRFFFSGIKASGAFNYPLPFGGYTLDESIDSRAPSVTQLAELRDFAQVASRLTDGAFNVNSTSPAAWAALFAAFLGERVATLAAGTRSDASTNPVLTAPLQYGGLYSDGGNTTSDNFHVGYRRLSTAQINALAAAMVEQVRKRGPFTSLAQFVNRSIDPDDAEFSANGGGLPNNDPTLAQLAEEPRLMGALQAAIDTAGLNDDSMMIFLLGSTIHSTWTHSRHPPPNVPAAMGPYLAGGPGYLNQGALLARLAPALSVRSDTFTVRAYGETLDPLTDAVDARAVCEAVIQRVYDYVDPADAVEVFPPVSATTKPSVAALRLLT